MKNYIEEYFKNPNNVHWSIFVNFNHQIVDWNEFFEMEEPEQERNFILFNHIKCKDGFTMSVQASYWHYCNPRVTLYSKNNFIYESMEVWYPNKKEEKLMPYACQDSWEWVYAQVPINTLNDIIENHWWIIS